MYATRNEIDSAWSEIDLICIKEKLGAACHARTQKYRRHHGQ